MTQQQKNENEMGNKKILESNGAARSSRGTFVKRPKLRKVSKEVILQIIELHYQKKSVRAIADVVKIAKTTVHNIVAGIPA